MELSVCLFLRCGRMRAAMRGEFEGMHMRVHREKTMDSHLNNFVRNKSKNDKTVP